MATHAVQGHESLTDLGSDYLQVFRCNDIAGGMVNREANYSVLMSVYAKDSPLFLDSAIESMANQTVKFNDMVIVCDGKLSAGLDGILEKWQKELGKRLTVLRYEENRGLGSALAVGLPHCRCNIVARMDADDLSRDTRCELLLNEMLDKDLDIVGGFIEEFDEKPGDLGVVRTVPLTQEGIERFAKRRSPFNHVSIMYKKDMVERVGSYEPFFHMEDYWLLVRMILAKAKCENIESVVVDVRVGSGMYARRSNAEFRKSQRDFFIRLYRFGFITRYECVRNTFERTIISLLPEKQVRNVYNRFLRRQVT